MKIVRTSGFTVLEMLVSLTLLALLLSGASLAMQAAQKYFGRTVSNSVIDADVNRTLNRVARRLTGAGRRTIFPVPDAPFGSTSLSFQEVIGWNAGSPQWSTDTEFRLEYEPGELDNGLDDDGDGLVDEGQVVQTERLGEADEISVVLVRGVREHLEGEEPDGADTNGNGLEDERGFCFELRGDELVVRLTIMRRGPEGGTDLRTLETAVALRN